jgi:hypothetical protein
VARFVDSSRSVALADGGFDLPCGERQQDFCRLNASRLIHQNASKQFTIFDYHIKILRELAQS